MSRRNRAAHARQSCKRHVWRMLDTVTVCACCGHRAPKRYGY